MSKPWKVCALAICLVFVLPLVLAGCGDGGDEDALVGIWTDQDGVIEYEFKSDGTLVFRFMGEEEQTTYTVSDGKISVPNPETGEQTESDYRIEGDNLILTTEGEEETLIKKE
jgi:hypothetical protein